jgi:hypothetical protein
METKRCKYCGEPLTEDDFLSTEAQDVCRACANEKSAYSGIVMKQSGNVDLRDVSVFAKEGDWLEVTQWANQDGIDIFINENHKEKTFSLTYDELNAILNIVNDFDGFFPLIFSDNNKFLKKLGEEI